MTKHSRWKRYAGMFYYGGLSSEEYKSIRLQLHAQNRRNLKVACLVGVTILVCLLIASFMLPFLEGNRILYAVTMLIFICIYALNESLVQRKEALALPLFYCFLVTAFAFGIILGVYLTPGVPSTTFCVLLFALPMLITDRPYRLSILLCAVTAWFCVATITVNPPTVAQSDLVNSISFLALGIAVNVFMMNVKFKQVLHAAVVEQERDTDELTKLLTKAAAARAIGHFLESASEKGALLVLDVDDYKSINDTMGHAYGDTVLRIVGECLREVFRQDDILGRFGGDEFVAFLPHVCDRSIIEPRIQRFVEMTGARVPAGVSAPRITTSIGIALYPMHASDYDSLFQCADEALYQAKAAGKNVYVFYGDDEA